MGGSFRAHRCTVCVCSSLRLQKLLCDLGVCLVVPGLLLKQFSNIPHPEERQITPSKYQGNRLPKLGTDTLAASLFDRVWQTLTKLWAVGSELFCNKGYQKQIPLHSLLLDPTMAPGVALGGVGGALNLDGIASIAAGEPTCV